MKNKANGRITYISQAQLIGCILVIFGHSYPLNWNIPAYLYFLEKWIYAFHMPLFFFISGYLFCKTKSDERYGFSEYIKKRARRLMIPYVSMTVIGFIPKVLMNSFFRGEGEFSIQYIIRTFLVPRENVWGHFWFLPTLMIISLFSFLFAKFKNKSKTGFCILTLALFAISYVKITKWFAINDVVNFTCFYALGMLYSDSLAENIITDKSYRGFAILVLPISVAALYFALKFKFFVNAITVVVGIMMIFCVLCISQLFDISDSRKGNFLLRKTYSIYILSWPFQSVVSIVFENILGLKYFVTMPISFVAGIVFPIFAIKIVDLIEDKTKKKFISPIIGG